MKVNYGEREREREREMVGIILSKNSNSLEFLIHLSVCNSIYTFQNTLFIATFNKTEQNQDGMMHGTYIA